MLGALMELRWERLISSYQCDSRIADAEFLFAKRQYLAKTGRKRGADDVIACTIRQSFVPGEITPEEANRLGYELARRFTKGKLAFIVCTHVDKDHIHSHIIWNSTTLDHDRKFRDFLGFGRWTSTSPTCGRNSPIAMLLKSSLSGGWDTRR